jgi:hypothetical protein
MAGEVISSIDIPIGGGPGAWERAAEQAAAAGSCRDRHHQ